MNKPKEKIDTFFYILALVFVGIAIMIIFTFRGVANAILLSSEFDASDTETELRINTAKLEEALNFVEEEKTQTEFVIRETRVTVPTLTPTAFPTATQ